MDETDHLLVFLGAQALTSHCYPSGKELKKVEETEFLHHFQSLTGWDERENKIMNTEKRQYTTMIGGQTITIETGKLASQAGGAVTVRLGDSLIFAAATMSNTPRKGIDFFPLTVDYEERMYAGGRIPGSFFRREGRPSTDAILVSRLT
ncbi:MAG: hypothetical protein U1B80_08105, partial [Anaerolineaceae bacterium]|nr:hypothetical protein [Anaerolineaceae bacterium]